MFDYTALREKDAYVKNVVYSVQGLTSKLFEISRKLSKVQGSEVIETNPDGSPKFDQYGKNILKFRAPVDEFSGEPLSEAELEKIQVNLFNQIDSIISEFQQKLNTSQT